MKKLTTVSLLITLFALSPAVSSATSVTGHRIVIDAGHGGTDGGSLACDGLSEADANLDIAKRLQALLEADLARVYMTRESEDQTLSNNYRYSLANSTDGEVLVSIHLNGSTNPSTNGTLGLYGKKNKDQSFTQVMHNALWDSLKNTPNFTDFGITNFASGVLLKSNMPATIQETVFISNPDECTALKDPSGDRQQQIAQALYQGLSDWFNQTSDQNGDDNTGGGKKCHTPPCGKNK